MKSEQSELTIVHTDENHDLQSILMPSLENSSFKSVDDIIELGPNSYVIIKKNVPQYKEDNGLIFGLDVSIPIAAAITSGAEYICLFLKIILI